MFVNKSLKKVYNQFKKGCIMRENSVEIDYLSTKYFVKRGFHAEELPNGKLFLRPTAKIIKEKTNIWLFVIIISWLFLLIGIPTALAVLL